MITSHLVYVDTRTEHLAQVDFGAPFTTGEVLEYSVPKSSWQWRVEFRDTQNDLVFDDMFLRARHIRAPHGETIGRWSTRVFLQASTTTLEGLFQFQGHGRHLDVMTFVIERKRNRRRLWLRFNHTASTTNVGGGTVVPGMPDILRRSIVA